MAMVAGFVQSALKIRQSYSHRAIIEQLENKHRTMEGEKSHHLLLKALLSNHQPVNKRVA